MVKGYENVMKERVRKGKSLGQIILCSTYNGSCVILKRLDLFPLFYSFLCIFMRNIIFNFHIVLLFLEGPTPGTIPNNALML